jgi:histidinol dehydrogenase
MGVRIIRTTDRGFERTLSAIIQRREKSARSVDGPVRKIIDSVRRQGDRAIVRYARLFEGARLSRSDIEVGRREMAQALAAVPVADLRALRAAARRIAAFHRRQLERSWMYRDPLGLWLGQKVAPLERVGVYVPGGKAAYPSTVLMNVVPARIAGVKEVIMASPLGSHSAPVLAAAHIAGVDRVFRVGGAQAIAALAFGTQTVPRVDKIVGPGNIYVATAKRLVFGQVDIDSIAGPSEILLLADASADPDYVAADMLSQAEHDELAAAFCVLPSRAMAERIKRSLERRLQGSRRRAISAKALEKYGAIIVVRNLKEGVEIANAIAPEHVEVMVRQPQRWLPLIRHAGAMFVGPYSAPPLGDYMAGPNHVLPTGGSARFFSPLGTYDFLKRTSVIRAGKRALRALAPNIIRLAELEGLYDHARAVRVRLGKEATDGQKG